MILVSAFAQMARKRLEEEFTLHVYEVLTDAGVVSLIDFAYGFSSELELTDFLLSKGQPLVQRRFHGDQNAIVIINVCTAIGDAMEMIGAQL